MPVPDSKSTTRPWIWSPRSSRRSTSTRGSSERSSKWRACSAKPGASPQVAGLTKGDSGELVAPVLAGDHDVRFTALAVFVSVADLRAEHGLARVGRHHAPGDRRAPRQPD